VTFPTLITEIAFTQNTGSYLVLDDTTNGKLDTNQLAAGAGFVAVWTDVTSYLQQFVCQRGRQRQVDQFATGSYTAQLKNIDGRFSPSNLSGPYVSSGVTEVQPGIAIRQRATWNGTTYNLWYGYIHEWDHDVAVDTPAAIFANVHAVDGFQRFSRMTIPTGSPVGGGETSGARVARVLDAAGWDGGMRDLDAGQATMQAADSSGVVLQTLQTIADSESGSIYMGEQGATTFRARYARITNTRSNTSQATFTDSSGGGGTGYCVIVPRHDDSLVVNNAQFTAVGGSTQTANDATSQAQYGVISLQKSNLLNQADTDVLGAAGWVVGRFRNPEFRVDSITIKPQANPSTLWPLVLGLKIDDRITVTHHPKRGDSITQDCFIEAISHSWTVGNIWQTTFQLSSAAAWLPFFILDSTTQGVIDTNVLAY
jgi:hypothetical protein